MLAVVHAVKSCYSSLNNGLNLIFLVSEVNAAIESECVCSLLSALTVRRKNAKPRTVQK